VPAFTLIKRVNPAGAGLCKPMAEEGDRQREREQGGSFILLLSATGFISMWHHVPTELKLENTFTKSLMKTNPKFSR